MTSAPKKRGRKPGEKVGPQRGSMADRLLSLDPGESAWFESSGSRAAKTQMQVAACAARNGLNGRLAQAGFLAVHPVTHEVVSLVRVTRLP